MAVSSPSIPPSGWWWIVFVPSLSYFLTTRWSSFSNSLLQPQQQQQQQHAASSAVSVNASLVWLPSSDSRRTKEENNTCAQVSKVFHVRNCRNIHPPEDDGSSAFVAAELTDRVEWLHDFSTTVVASVWQHSDELGRGGSLVSSGNRIWRWERGGGPIPIGRSLQLDHAGCRSDRTATCRPSPLASTTPDPTTMTNWVGGLAMDFWGSDRSTTLSYSMGSLIVAEWGEGRLVRLEDNGARTPLALLRAPPCHDHKKKKLDTPVDLYPHQLLMTPFGDLLVLDSVSSSSSSCIYKVPQALTIPPLESLQESRWAHNHSWLEEEGLLMEEPQLFWTPPGAAVVTGMALTSSWTSLYVAVSTTEESSSAALLYQVSLVEEEDENEDGGQVKEEPHDNNGAKPEQDTHTQTSPSKGHLVLNVTQHVPWWTRSGPLVVTKQGYLFSVVEHVHLTIWNVVSSPTTVLVGFVTLPDAITSLSLGGVEDSYLYLTTVRSLWRLPTRRGVAHPVTIPTNLAPTHRRPQQPRNQHTHPSR